MLFRSESGIFGADEDALEDAWCEFAGGAFADPLGPHGGIIGIEDDLIDSRVPMMRLFEAVTNQIKKAHKRHGRFVVAN